MENKRNWKIKTSPHPKDSLFTSQRSPGPGPEENVGLSTGDNGVRVSGVELHGQDHLVSGLKHTSYNQFHTVRHNQSKQVRHNYNRLETSRSQLGPLRDQLEPVRNHIEPVWTTKSE